MNNFLLCCYLKIAYLKWTLTNSLLFIIIFFLILVLSLTPFGLYYQTNLYQQNWNQGLSKYVLKNKYYLNKNFSGYKTIIEPQLIKVFNQNTENIIVGLIGHSLKIDNNQALYYKDREIDILNQDLNKILDEKNELWEIISSYNLLLFELIKKYTIFSVYSSGWRANLNINSIKQFISLSYKKDSLIDQLNYFLEGDKEYSWSTNEGELVYFKGLQYYEYYVYSNYLSMLDSFVSGSIQTRDPILLGNWNTNDLDYFQFLKVKILSENFYHPLYLQAFIIQRIDNIILFIILPIITILGISFLSIGWIIWIKNQNDSKKWNSNIY
ncbi:hypothetical protein SSYRP_v1c00560 [Spiroplasma syrphidicola EA-1]|uniref:Transmembrane protein n=1 Tax=Spiroplasma syrphidicola EA-1 TaxID=1276229 RepID=R4U2R5_9MOLU|nr:hypothetical protein [Spiroplasma syrphidicola]AGM25652.1 hypothetical protein SSYRP_v1c00560 [Spiroplasma syrphidicola EA-1]